MAKNFIAGAIKHPGALHKELGVPQGQKIPQKKLAKAAKAGGKLGERARFAETLEKLPHKGGGKKRANNPHGNPGHHPSTDGYDHQGYTHDSDDR